MQEYDSLYEWPFAYHWKVQPHPEPVLTLEKLRNRRKNGKKMASIVIL